MIRGLRQAQATNLASRKGTTRKILITGGTGPIDANLAQALLAKGHEIRTFVYSGDASRAHKLDGFVRT